MMKKSDASGAINNRASKKVMRHLFGVVVVLMMLCLVVATPASASGNIFINVFSAPEEIVQGTSADFVINAEASNDGIQYYIIGTNFFEYGTVPTADDGTTNKFTIELSECTTESIDVGQYFAVFQHPMSDGVFQIKADGTDIELDGTRIFNVADLQAAEAAQALCDALDVQTIDDLYIMYEFFVVGQGETVPHMCSDDSITDWQGLNSIYSSISSGNYYLTDDIEVSSEIYVYGTVNLCLNGHTISIADGATGPVINIDNNAVLNLYDCIGTGKITGGNSQYYGAIYFYGSTLNMYGGSIADNIGPGVYMSSGSMFNMYGGTITNNTAESGGGVYMPYDGTFNMYGGNISGNSASSYYGGGGVALCNGGLFNMFDGVISNNSAVSSTGSYTNGGGVYLDGHAVFNMTGGLITNNTASIGGGIYGGSQSVLTIINGTISDNIATYEGGGVYGHILMYDGMIANNTALHGGGVSGNLTMYGGTISGNTADTGGGHFGKGMLIGGDITENSAYNGAGIATNRYGFTITEGNISYNKNGPAVWVTPDGGDSSTLTMTGGSIVYTAGNYNYGVSVSHGGSFIMSGGSIIDILESEWDSAADSNVYVYNENGVYYGNFTTSGGTFSHEVGSEYVKDGYACYAELGKYVVMPLGYIPSSGPGDSGENLKDTYIVGIDVEYPPFTYLDDNGNPTGFDVESIQWIAEQQGFNVIIQPTDWSDIIIALDAGVIDMIYSGMSITPEYAELVTFSNPYYSDSYYGDLGVAMRKDDTALHAVINEGIAELKSSGKWDELVAKYMGGSSSNPTPTPDDPTVPTLTPSESLPDNAEIKTNTVAETNAATKAEVGYQVKPTDINKMKAPTITRGSLSVMLNDNVKVMKKLSDGSWVEVEAKVNEDGSISVTGSLDGAESVTVNFIGRQFGDVTNDGKPDTLDAARVLQASVGLYDFSNADTFYGDVSGDGFANTLDAARILQYSVNLVDENYVTKV